MVFVGAERKKFILHREYFCRHSSVLKKFFDNDVFDAETEEYALADVTSDSMDLFVKWMYTKKIPVAPERYRTLLR